VANRTTGGCWRRSSAPQQVSDSRPDNVETVRLGFAAMERGDVDAIVEMLDPEVEFVNPDYAVEPGVRQGVDAYVGALAAFTEIFDTPRFFLDELVEVGDKIVVTGRFSARAKGSGVNVGPQRFGGVMTIRGGRLLRYEWFREPAEAHAAAVGDTGPKRPSGVARPEDGA
jgi:ketosteroid isomerase-like protein